MATLTKERKAELVIEIAKFPNENPKKLAIKFAITSMQVGGIRKTITANNLKANQQVAEFKANEKKSKKVAITETNTYSNSAGANKQRARELMTKYITLIGLNLSLPWIECAIEKMLLELNPNHSFIGVERDKETHELMKKFIKANKLPIKTHLGNISEKIYGAIPNTYANLILDYCGELPTIANELKYAIDNDIMEVDGVMAVTFAKPIRKVTNYYGKQITGFGSIISNVQGDTRCLSDKSVEAYFHKICGFDYELVEIFNYQDTYPMTLVIVRRLK